MKHERVVITAYSRLSRMREAITPAMAREKAEAMLEKERSRKRKRGCRPYIHLRIERQQPIQLMIKFKDYEQ